MCEENRDVYTPTLAHSIPDLDRNKCKIVWYGIVQLDLYELYLRTHFSCANSIFRQKITEEISPHFIFISNFKVELGC